MTRFNPAVNLRNVGRIRDLPEEHQEPFSLWARQQFPPPVVYVAEGEADETQDGYYLDSYQDWLELKRANRTWDDE